ncbi:MAG TPA: threonine/serine dehydratase [Candidatus Angelobacter sp.]|jgi:threonine dehydratase|nr:threonine/serine dehydratase [Candidatus Angelobacter sp.]
MPKNSPAVVAASEQSRTIDRPGIAQIYHQILPYIRRTPVVDIAPEDFGIDAATLSFKLEYLQHTGSFKTRGAVSSLLLRPVPPAGVVAASGGNHGAAVAYAAKRFGVPARIFVPSVASPAKIERIRNYGAELVIGGERYADALAASEAWREKSGAMAVHAYDQPETLLGQGTVGLELSEQLPGLDTLFVAVGGGGLLGGIAAWYERRINVIGVEPETAPTLTRALEAGKPVDAEAGGIAADSLAPRRVGELMFPLAKKSVKRVQLVPDQAIGEAQQKLWEVLRVVTEPGGAAAFAPLLLGLYRPAAGERVGVLLCGANTTAVNFSG